MSFLAFSAFAQSSDLYLEYDVLLNGKSKTGKFYKSNNNSLFYYSKDKESDTKVSEEHTDTGVEYSVELKSGDDFHGIVKTNLDSRSVLSTESLFSDGKYTTYTILDTLQGIKWSLNSENKKIGNYFCQKATGNYRGRTYTVWYTLEIPTTLGPWKLHGLPGAIVEAHDNDNYIHFQLTKIKSGETLTDNAESVLNKKDAISCHDFSLLKDSQGDAISKHIQSKLPRGASFNITTVKNNWLEKECD